MLIPSGGTAAAMQAATGARRWSLARSRKARGLHHPRLRE